MAVKTSGFCGPKRGNTRPPQDPNGKCGKVWVWVLNNQGAPLSECLSWGLLNGLNEGNVKQEYGNCHRWLRLGSQRNTDSEILLKISPQDIMLLPLGSDFDLAVSQSLSEPEKRLSRLSIASKDPQKIEVMRSEFKRNPDVVAEALFRSKGICEICKKPAPFNKKFDGSPFLEVHHKIQLSQGGEDSIENAIALCPNCHREAHYG
ncbi:MAG: HNH endonuclease [Methylococcaceae bacterium]